MNKEDQNSRHAKWQAIIKEQEASGLSQAKFCKERHISSVRLGYYRSILKPKKKEIGSFKPVTIKQSTMSQDIRITLPNGFQCIFSSDLNTLQIKEWITVLLSC